MTTGDRSVVPGGLRELASSVNDPAKRASDGIEAVVSVWRSMRVWDGEKYVSGIEAMDSPVGRDNLFRWFMAMQGDE